MLPQLKPTDQAVEQLALAETDIHQQARFAPIRWGFIGNLALMGLIAPLGFLHSLLAAMLRPVIRLFRNDTP